jgi:putative tricarboxylic transport membrane protein
VKRTALPLLATYLALIAIAIALFVGARTFPSAHMGPASPGFFPQVVAILLAGLSLLGILELRSEDPPVAVVSAPVLTGMAAALGYIGLMSLVGYYPSTFAFAVLIMWLVRNGASLVRILVDAAAIVLVCYLLFSLVVEAYLPAGTLFGG